MTIGIVYHDGCWDGMTAAYIMRLAHPEAYLSPWNYDNNFVRIERGTSKLFVVDISRASRLLVQIRKVFAGEIVWIDHHLGDAAAVDPLVTYHIDIATCAAVGAWKYVKRDDEIPYYVELVNAHDTFTEMNFFNEVVRVYMLTHKTAITMEDINSDFAITTRDNKYFDILVAMIKNHGYKMLTNLITGMVDADIPRWVTWQSPEGPTLVCIVTIRELTGIALRYQIKKYSRFARETMEIQLGLIMVIRRGSKKTYYIMRGASDDINCAAIAEHYGGGGHRAAASFALPNDKAILTDR